MINSLYDRFAEWSRGGSIWLISDTHFDDEDCKLMDPKWIPSFLQAEIINQKVQPCDTLIHLGDVGNTAWFDFVRAKRKILITGNHDKVSEMYGHFTEVFNGPVFIADRILLSHEPIFGLEDFCFNFHGHDHAGTQHRNHMNLAANVCGYTPVNLGKLIKKGVLANIPNYHRLTIDEATKNGIKAEKEKT